MACWIEVNASGLGVVLGGQSAARWTLDGTGIAPRPVSVAAKRRSCAISGGGHGRSHVRSHDVGVLVREKAD
jgi:hypothetical protein